MKKKILLDTLKKNKNLILLFAVTSIINLAVFLLYKIFTEAFIYAETIIFFIAFLLILLDFIKNLKKAKTLASANFSFENGNAELPLPEFFDEEEYQKIIRSLSGKINTLGLSFAEEKQDINDWYTVWVHQIKTPIAVLKLKIPETQKEILNELFRIEEYADMALSYIRLGSEQNDLVIKEYSLDELIKETLHKYAVQFISKKIKLDYSQTDKTVITDKKWLLCILEQFISNAVKYTISGCITITVEGNRLTVSDTGIGIADEDLPRIFEKGYTGQNGRADAKSSGLGLYLCSKAAKLINVTLKAESEKNKGSKFSVEFNENSF